MAEAHRMNAPRPSGWVILLPLLYLGWMLGGSGALTAFELNPDEGVNLIKAWLLSQGHPLYTSIWSDQPPVLTFVLSALINLCGVTVALPRLLMLLASTAFLWGVGRHLRATAGLPHALIAQTLILAQPAFYYFSAAVMVGLPALYLAFASSFAMIRARQAPRHGWLLLSVVLLALSLTTKLFTGVIIPAALIYLIAAPRPAGPPAYPHSRLLVSVLWLLGVTAGLALLILALVGWEDVTQLVVSHWRARHAALAHVWPTQTFRQHLGPIPWLPPLAAAGAVYAAFRRDAARLYFAGWCAVAALALSLHAPVWQHQQLLFTLPAALLGGYGVGEGLSVLMRRLRPEGPARWLLPATLLALGLALVVHVQKENWYSVDRSRFALDTDHPQLQALLQPLAMPEPHQHQVITDRPMLAYRAGREAPAWIAALTMKRILAGELSEAEVMAEVHNQGEPQVVLARFAWPALREQLQQSHQITVSNGLGVLYQRKINAHPRTQAARIQAEWQAAVNRPSSWYHSGEARRMAGIIMQTQGPHGGWAKRMSPYGAQAPRADAPDADDESLDNDSTLAQLRFLLRMLQANDRPAYRAALQRGVDYLLDSQYPSGGWPQVYPHLFSYHALATLNDGVTVNTARLLTELQRPGQALWLSTEQQARGAAAVARTVDFLVRSQVRVQGRRTGWCQQMDPVSLAPKPARAFEPIALASRETTQALAFLMEQEAPSRHVVEAIESGVAWLRSVRIDGLRIEQDPLSLDRTGVPDPGAPPLWARFYQIDSQQPVFIGRDGIPHDRLEQLEPERRSSYEYYVRDPQPLLEKDYPAWLRKRSQRA